MPENLQWPSYCTEEHLKYLDNLRETGETNMFGAAPWLYDTFDDLDTMTQARQIVTYWMSSFGERHPK